MDVGAQLAERLSPVINATGQQQLNQQMSRVCFGLAQPLLLFFYLSLFGFFILSLFSRLYFYRFPIATRDRPSLFDRTDPNNTSFNFPSILCVSALDPSLNVPPDAHQFRISPPSSHIYIYREKTENLTTTKPPSLWWCLSRFGFQVLLSAFSGFVTHTAIFEKRWHEVLCFHHIFRKKIKHK